VKLSKKKIEDRIQAAYQASCSDIAVPIMELPKIWNIGRATVLGGDDDATLQGKMRAAVDAVAVKVA